MSADEATLMSASPASSGLSALSGKRSFESDFQGDEDEEGRKRKKKDDSGGKDLTGVKGITSRGQSVSRNNAGVDAKVRNNTFFVCNFNKINTKCNIHSFVQNMQTKSGKQNSNAPSTKSNTSSNVSSNSSINVDHKSPSALSANSPKPSSASNTSSSSQKNNQASASSTLGPTAVESDGDDDRSKSSDSGSGPKVPPLKIVIPQSTTSEQEQGNRNGKNASNRSHQLPYVVASSNNSNDSMDKEQSSVGSPMESSALGIKIEEKKDFTGALDEARSIHHQRVLRSSHRSGNGNGNSQGNGGSYSNSSPLSIGAADGSNNPSPQRISPTPETSEKCSTNGNKVVSADSPSPSIKSTANSSTDKCEKNIDVKKEPIEITEIKKENIGEVASSQSTVELHPRKRKIKSNKETQQQSTCTGVTENIEVVNSGPEVHPHDQPITNCQQLYLNIRNQVRVKNC